MESCIFCKIIAGEIPARKILETERTLAFLDINPMTEGHTVVIPKEHAETLDTLPEHVIPEYFRDLKAVAKLLKEKLNLKGYNLLQNNGKVAWQEVPHMHFHIIPRREEDRMAAVRLPKLDVTAEDLDKLLEKIQK